MFCCLLVSLSRLTHEMTNTLVHLGQIPRVPSTKFPLYIIGRMTNNRPPQTSFHMTSLFQRHRFHCKIDVLEVARLMSWTWQERCHGHGKRDVLDVERETFGMWQEQRLGCGKRDILDVERETSGTWQERRLGHGKRDVLDVARETSWTCQERRLGGGKRDVKRYIISDMVVMGATLLEVAREASWMWQE